MSATVPTVVIGTAGHIDHGKTTLLRALTGIDADRLPEEQARGMTIDVGYAHLDLPDGSTLDFVDVPGHDRLVGNMLVGAGEIDAAMLVVAADDGARAQTFEHLELLDALGVRDGLAVITKVDVVDAARLDAVTAAVAELIGRTCLAGAPVLAASGMTGFGIVELRDELVALRDRVVARSLTRPAGPRRLAVDRAFAIKGRGTVVTGTLRGGTVQAGTTLRLVPEGAGVRVREVQVHNATVAMADLGRAALNLAGVGLPGLRRGQVLTTGPGVEASNRLLVALHQPARMRPAARPSTSGVPGNRPWPPPDGSRLTLHLGTAQVWAQIGRRGRDAVELSDGIATAILRLAEPAATLVGDRGVLRQPELGRVVAGVTVLDPIPPRGVSRRRGSRERLATLAAAVADADGDAVADALVAIHGGLPAARLLAVLAALRPPGVEPAPEVPAPGGLVLAADVSQLLESQARRLVTDRHVSDPLSQGVPAADLRDGLLLSLRRAVAIDRSMLAAAREAVVRVVDGLVARGALARAGDRFHDPEGGTGPPGALAEAMDRLEAALNVPAPPSLAEAARAAGCPAEGVRALTTSGRIVRIEADLAWSAAEYQRLAAVALAMAARAPLPPAAFRDVTGTTRRYVLAILEDLDRRGLLQRTDTGHVLGPRAPRGDAVPAPTGPGADR